MWHFFKSKPKQDPFDFIGIDMHSHLLPNVDDGVKTMDESSRLLGSLAELGIKKIVLTPHIYRDIYPNKKAGLEKAYAAFLQKFASNNIEIDVKLAAEYYLDEHFTELLVKGELLTFGKEKYVLVETSFVGLAMNLRESLFEITTSGFVPILAHPERYHYLVSKRFIFNQLVEQGVKLQINLPSLVGYYGKISVDICNYLLKENLVSFVGSDIHHEKHLEALYKLSKSSQLLKKLRKINLLNVLL